MAVSARRRGSTDHDPDPAPLGAYVKPGPDGQLLRRTAATPSEAVALVFDGWQPDTTAPATTAAIPAPAPAAAGPHTAPTT